MLVFCLADGAGDVANGEGLRSIVRSVTAIPLTRWGTRVRALTALATGKPLSVTFHAEAALLRAVREGYAALRPDLIIVYSGNMAQFAEPFTDVPRIMQFAELDSLKWGHYAERTRPPMRWIYAIEHARLLAYERRIAHSFTLSLLCTDFELAEFKRLIPGAPAACVRNGVDLDYFQPHAGAKRSGELVFTGVMDYMPNIDAVQWFSDAVLPIVRQAHPVAHFTICGSRPSKAVRDLAKRPGISVTGRVPDVRPYLDVAEVAVVPF